MTRLPALALLCALLRVSVGEVTTIPAADPTVVRLGRVFDVSPSGVGLSWLGGGIRVTHTGRTLRATFAAAPRPFRVVFYQSNEGYMPFEGVAWVPASGLNETIVIGAGAGTIDLLLNVGAEEWGSGATILSLSSDGEFSSSVAPTRILHALGDSITAATNVRGGYHGCGDNGMQSDYSSSWMGILCDFFDASCSTVAVYGHGLVRNCCNQSDGLMPDFYQRTAESDSTPTFPFKDAAPAGMLIYLGTNDYNAGESPALDAAFSSAMVKFMLNVTRVWYGTPSSPANVTFFAVLGPMSPKLPANATLAGLKEAAAMGLNAVLINATTACGPELTGCTDGCAGHPGVASHRSIAQIAAPIISKALGWPMPGVL